MLVPQRGRHASMVAILQLGMLGLMWEILAACGEDCQMAFHDGNNACLQAALRVAMLTSSGRVNRAVRPSGHCWVRAVSLASSSAVSLSIRPEWPGTHSR